MNTKISALSTILTCALLAHAGVVDAKVKAGNESKGWIFDQSSDEGGRGETIISPKGVRIKLKTLVAVLAAPKFDAIIYDTSSKKYIFLSHSDWTRKYETKDHRKAIETNRTTKVAGMNSRCYQIAGKSTKDVWFSTDVPISDDMSVFVGNILRVPSGHGMPLRMEVTKSQGARVKIFDTLKVSSAKIDPKIFQAPTGYKKVDSELQLFVKEDSLKDMGGFLQ